MLMSPTYSLLRIGPLDGFDTDYGLDQKRRRRRVATEISAVAGKPAVLDDDVTFCFSEYESD